jgi:predicted negative regulator of RcsB-dependent stress response
MEEYDVAEKQLKKAAEINPSGTIVEHYGDVLFKLGNTKEALTQWQKAKEIGGASDRIDKKIQDKQFYE